MVKEEEIFSPTIGNFTNSAQIAFIQLLQKFYGYTMIDSRRLRTPCFAIGVCTVCILLVSGAQAAEFIRLGSLTDENFGSAAEAVSSDGSVVVGSSNNPNEREAFRWTVETGMVGLGDLPTGEFRSEASGVSADGRIVVVNMEIEMTSGGLFDAATVIKRTDPPGSDGTIILTFTGCNSGTIEYNIPSISRIGTVPIQRVATDNVVICEALNSD
jgi:probable HAF family extracellular repeat protein